MAIELLREDDEREVCETEIPGVTNPDPDVFYTIRKITATAHRALVKKHTDHVFERGVGRVEKIDSLALMDDVLDYVLRGWRGIQLQGQPAPCEKTYKVNGFDFERRQALIDLAGMNEIAGAAERRAHSFRSVDRVS